MSIVLFLAPFSVALGALGLAAFWWTLNNAQYEDPRGDAERILSDDPVSDRPFEDAPAQPQSPEA
ncbi:MAG: cytochrome oxidase maturation protein, cbb3-type [Caulobacterales bacterium 32-69-10]|nr:MAG: cytochrome oxidase maturation protein, cbb3-type [Caulobacterales bacterium 32-69-10]